MICRDASTIYRKLSDDKAVGLRTADPSQWALMAADGDDHSARRVCSVRQ
ncbi:predicted protein [Streptomyces filamentosus NRRL 15998]|uniref:Predicted protein n=1 Tax=Streptomyces filamentosus NRRL 15998 TaxID=457431 RepID=D6AIW6_STRFL|nr:predicted protein [Streptomyces filamentosus NRRL 15998]